MAFERPMNDKISEDEAARLEDEYVHKVYDVIAPHFSHTRHSPWPKVIFCSCNCRKACFWITVARGRCTVYLNFSTHAYGR